LLLPVGEWQSYRHVGWGKRFQQRDLCRARKGHCGCGGVLRGCTCYKKEERGKTLKEKSVRWCINFRFTRRRSEELNERLLKRENSST